eukprot:scaffold25896_cov228-Skeletonema_marinoi.AAC.7
MPLSGVDSYQHLSPSIQQSFLSSWQRQNCFCFPVKDVRVKSSCSCGACEDNNDSDIVLLFISVSRTTTTTSCSLRLFVHLYSVASIYTLHVTSIFRQYCEITHSRLILCVTQNSIVFRQSVTVSILAMRSDTKCRRHADVKQKDAASTQPAVHQKTTITNHHHHNFDVDDNDDDVLSNTTR